MNGTFLGDECSQDIVEYLLLLVLLGVVAFLALTAMGASISSIFAKINNHLSAAEKHIS